MSPQAFEAVFGHDAAVSDYAFAKRVYEFTPEKMHHWTLSSPIFAREEVLLMVKSIMPSKPAETGIFNIRNQGYQGFQQGDPRIRQERLQVDLYSGNGCFEITIFQKDYANPLRDSAGDQPDHPVASQVSNKRSGELEIRIIKRLSVTSPVADSC